MDRRVPGWAPHLAAAAEAALDNARRLISDARLLGEAGRHPTAHALAVLAMEEAGKHVMMVAADTKHRWGVGYERGLPERSRDHLAKLRAAVIFMDALDETVEDAGHERMARLVELAKSTNVRKLSGFYVDLRRDGVSRPSELIDSAEASELVARVDGLVSVLSDVAAAPRGARTDPPKDLDAIKGLAGLPPDELVDVGPLLLHWLVDTVQALKDGGVQADGHDD